MSGEALPDLLLQNIDEPIQINLEDASHLKWGKSLRNMPLFTITLERRRTFKDERYISANSIFPAIQGLHFTQSNLQS